MYLSMRAESSLISASSRSASCAVGALFVRVILSIAQCDRVVHTSPEIRATIIQAAPPALVPTIRNTAQNVKNYELQGSVGFNHLYQCDHGKISRWAEELSDDEIVLEAVISWEAKSIQASLA